jgi:hypothetical protein
MIQTVRQWGLTTVIVTKIRTMVIPIMGVCRIMTMRWCPAIRVVACGTGIRVIGLVVVARGRIAHVPSIQTVRQWGLTTVTVTKIRTMVIPIMGVCRIMTMRWCPTIRVVACGTGIRVIGLVVVARGRIAHVPSIQTVRQWGLTTVTVTKIRTMVIPIMGVSILAEKGRIVGRIFGIPSITILQFRPRVMAHGLMIASVHIIAAGGIGVSFHTKQTVLVNESSQRKQ